MKPFALAWATGDCLTWLTRIVENHLIFSTQEAESTSVWLGSFVKSCSVVFESLP